MKLRKLMFVLPNLFTVTSIFCGFYAMTLCAGEASPAHLYQAALAIFFAMFFDGFDGRVARLTRTQSQFGVELDSLADVGSFGLAPGLLVYKWALWNLGMLGIFISFAFAACGALRLARFNVLAQRNPHGGGSRFFVGLPIPLAAGVIVSLVIAHGAQAPVGQVAVVPLAIVVAFLSLLMVSTVRYRTFKDIRLSPRSASIFTVLCIGGVVIATRFNPAYLLVVYFSLYLALGLVESGLLLRKHLAQKRAAPTAGALGGAAVAAQSVENGEDEDEDEDEGGEDAEDFL